MYNFIKNKDFSHVSNHDIETALIEYYMRRTPLVSILNQHHNLGDAYRSNLSNNEKCESKEKFVNNKINTHHSKGVQTDTILTEPSIQNVQPNLTEDVEKKNKKDKYNYVMKIKDKRNRRSTAWKLYKDYCMKHDVEPQLKYPAGDDRDYIRLLLELETTLGPNQH